MNPFESFIISSFLRIFSLAICLPLIRHYLGVFPYWSFRQLHNSFYIQRSKGQVTFTAFDQ